MTASTNLADICVVAAAEAFRGNGEIFGSGMGTIQTLGVRLARATFEPDLLVSDGEAFFVANDLPIGGFRQVFDTLWGGRRHVMMGASQIDQFGNSNIANIGPWKQPKAQLLGVRGAPGNTINNKTSFFIPKHTSKVFVEKVDMVSGIGYDRVAKMSKWVRDNFSLPRVITNMCVLDFETPDNRMRLRSVHPGVSVDDVVANTSFELVIPASVPESRGPTADELAIIEKLDPRGLRHKEVA